MTRKTTAVRFLVVAAGVQVGLGFYRAAAFLRDLPETSTLLRAGEPGAGTGLLFPLAVLVVAILRARRPDAMPGGRWERAGAWGLAHMAGAGIAMTLAGLLTSRYFPAAGWGVLVLSAAWGVTRRAGPEPPAAFALPVRPSPWDAATGLLLLLLLFPSAWPFVHTDAAAIWGCRADLVAGTGSLSAILDCSQPGYPPLFSLLLALGGSDPVLGGRPLVAFVLLFLALFLRGRISRLAPRAAPAATAFVVSTGHVWVGAAMFYANAPLMAFLSAGGLLALGVPRAGLAAVPSGAEKLAGALCLGAAALTRPDGVYYAAALSAAAAWSALRGQARPAWWALGAAAAGWGAWALRPASLRGADFLDVGVATWRSAGETPARAIATIFAVLGVSAQGQWLAHWGLGVTVWVLLAAAVARRRLGNLVAPGESVLGAVTFASLAAVAVCYAAIPFVSDPVSAVQPFESFEYAACWRNFVRVGFGRMTVHLLPFYVLWVVSLIPRVGGNGQHVTESRGTQRP